MSDDIGVTPYRSGWLAGMRFAADCIRTYIDEAPTKPDEATQAHLLAVGEALALGASMREVEWKSTQGDVT